MSSNKTLNLLSICAKAGKLTGGFDKSLTAVKEGTSSCILLAENVSAKTAKEVRFVCQKYNTPVYIADFTALKEQYNDYIVVGDTQLVGEPSQEVCVYEQMYEISKAIAPVKSVHELVPTYIKDIEVKQIWHPSEK